MKLIMFITTTITITVIRIDIRDDPTVSPPIGRDRTCTPCHAIRPAAMNCPASFVIQSRSQRSSATPSSTISKAAPRMARIC